MKLAFFCADQWGSITTVIHFKIIFEDDILCALAMYSITWDSLYIDKFSLIRTFSRFSRVPQSKCKANQFSWSPSHGKNNTIFIKCIGWDALLHSFIDIYYKISRIIPIITLEIILLLETMWTRPERKLKLKMFFG